MSIQKKDEGIVYPFFEMVGHGVTVTFELRPPHCNRGHIMTKAFVEPHSRVSISEADPWPRYYFYGHHAVWECVEWLRRHGALEDGELPTIYWCVIVEEQTRRKEVTFQRFAADNATISPQHPRGHDDIHLDSEKN